MINLENYRIKDGWNGELSGISVSAMPNGHMLDCASQGEGPCTCGTEEELAAIASEDFE